jgi:iron complex transport system ATP-binding protein
MALAQEAEILLLDEPTTFLDIHHQIQILELIRSMNRDIGRTVVVVLHDLNHAARFAEKIVVLRGGGIYGEGAAEDILTPGMLRDVFRIEADVFTDRNNDCPCFLPITSV